MRIIAMMNQKGGVGKTTTTVNLGAALAEAGQRVCLVDMDPQAHLTINYGIEPRGEHCSLYDVLVDGKGFLEAVQNVGRGIAVVPSSIDLAAAEVELVAVLGREMILKRRLDVTVHDFDYMLLDCPPSLGLLTINALAVADDVIIPMQPHFLALQGVGKLLETVALVNRRMNPRLKVSGIALTMFDSQTKLSGEVVEDLCKFIDSANGQDLPWSGAKVFKTRIRRNIKLAECPSFGKTIFQYEPTSNGATDYRALAREVMGEPDMPPAAAVTAPAVATVPSMAPPAAVRVTVNPVDPLRLAVRLGATLKEKPRSAARAS
jgi:chromosome partitioning protein